MRKILIIGSKGMLGQELVKVFKKDSDYKVIGWDKEDIDITREKEVDKKIGIIKPEIIINAAAYNAVDKCEGAEEFKIAKKVNGLAPGYLAKIAKKLKATLVHYSTDYVFDGDLKKLLFSEPSGCTHVCATCSLHENREIGYGEEHEPNPISNYGKSKFLGEQEVKKNYKNYYIIRLSKLFGKPAISEGAKKSFFDIMLELGRKNKEVHPVEYAAKRRPPKAAFNRVKAVDEETSCFTYAPDLAKKTKEIIDSKKPFGIYHVTNSGSCTWHEACVELYKLAKIRTKVIPVSASEFPRPAKRPQFSVLLNTKLNPLRDWKEALKEYLKNIK
jgi:dTDP-4-dehydrorhamnose reductase